MCVCVCVRKVWNVCVENVCRSQVTEPEPPGLKMSQTFSNSSRNTTTSEVGGNIGSRFSTGDSIFTFSRLGEDFPASATRLRSGYFYLRSLPLKGTTWIPRGPPSFDTSTSLTMSLGDVMDDGRMKERREGKGGEKGGEDTVWRGGDKTRDGEKKTTTDV